MIYYSNGLRSNQLNMGKKSNQSDFERLAGKLDGEKQSVLSLSLIDEYKQKQALYIIAGQLKKPIRNNENMLNRSLIVLDLDDIKADEQAFIKAISLKFKNVRHLAYPTISHNIKGTRYRLIFDISRPITDAEEYSGLIELLTRDIYENILQQSDYKADISNKTFAQLQGWHVVTEANKDSSILIHTEGKPLPVDKLLKKIEPPSQNDFKADYTPTHYGVYKKPREWTKVMRTLISGEIHEGERHQFYLMAFRTILFGCIYDDELLGYYIDLIEKFNASRCFPPYPVKDLEKEFKEALRYVSDRT